MSAIFGCTNKTIKIIKTAKRERRKAEKRWRRTRLDTDLAAFKAKEECSNCSDEQGS